MGCRNSVLPGDDVEVDGNVKATTTKSKSKDLRSKNNGGSKSNTKRIRSRSIPSENNSKEDDEGFEEGSAESSLAQLGSSVI